MSKTKLTFVLVTTALIAAQLGAVGPAGAVGDVVLTDGQVLSTSLVATTISLPLGATVYFAESITLSATDWIDISGQLRDQTGGGPKDITIEAGTSASIGGAIISEAGASGSSATGDVEVSGAGGARGGDITIRWGALGQLTLSDGALIRSGDGGNGGSANVTSGSATQRSIQATGGPGGRGGDIVLDGATALLYGQMRVGVGGHGGNASAWSLATRASSSQLYSNATGGVAAPSGALSLPVGHSVLTLYNAGQLFGGTGGNGGSADVGAEGVNSCGSDGYHAPNDAATRDGTDGCDGSSDYAYGPDGGFGVIIGGSGGSASAVGTDGTAGGDGAAGEVVASGCATYVIPGYGGGGGNGGYAYAEGGNGGYGYYAGGRGGDAIAHGGDGASGGSTGNGGRSPTRCTAHLDNCSYQGYGASCFVDSAGAGCGHTWPGGSGGINGGFAVQAGIAGGSLTGIDAGDGSTTGSSGANGGAGTGGAFSCTHSGSHAHY